jgi:hypothetical protein
MPQWGFTIMDVAALLGLNIRQYKPTSVYVDCPFCGEKQGRMNLNIQKNCWRCNYCGESGGMLKLYGNARNVDNSQAYQEITKALGNGYITPVCYTSRQPVSVENSGRASISDIHKTISELLNMLTLSDFHRRKLRERGLTDAKIDRLGYKSAPPSFQCQRLTAKLLENGCISQGIPGFYKQKNGQWTVNFNDYTAGFLIPVRDFVGNIQGCQIRLDKPFKGKHQYIWLSSADRPSGVSAGGFLHFVGNPRSESIYVTEGALKGDVANFFTGRSFLCMAGANNWGRLEQAFSTLAKNGVKLVVETHDMDKFTNENIMKGADKICETARKCGLDVKRLKWDPKYKGIDDLQLVFHKQAVTAA